MPKQEIVLIVEPDGCSRHIVSDDNTRFAVLGEPVNTMRASCVEPWSSLSLWQKLRIMWRLDATWPIYDKDRHQMWFAILRPCRGPLLGPYWSRGEALAAEVKWLNAHDLPVPAGL